MCNLYSITTNQAAIAALFRVVNRYVGNLPPMPGVFPDYPAPVVRNAGTEREILTIAAFILVAAGSSVRSDLRPNRSHGKENLIQLAALETNLPGPGLARRTS